MQKVRRRLQYGIVANAVVLPRFDRYGLQAGEFGDKGNDWIGDICLYWALDDQ